MKTRIITAAVAIAFLIPVLVFSDTWVFPLAMGLLALIAVYEIAGCVGVRRKLSLAVTSYLFAAAILFLMLNYFMGFRKFLPTLFGVGYLYIFLIFAFTMLSRGNIKFSQAAELVAVTGYIVVGFVCLVLLRNYTKNGENIGKYLYLLSFLGAWMTDTGAYFIGKFFGKRKLIPEISPNKTVAGAFGGILGCAVGYAVYGLILTFSFSVKVNFLYLILLAVVISVVSQLGDLIASCIKRENGIKDFGKLFPGHGGVLDRFDSILAVSPFLYGIILLLPEGIRIIG